MNKLKYLIPILLLLSACSDYPTCKADQVIIGMSEEELIELCGNPHKNYSSGSSTQWLYRGNQSLYVYTINKKVRSKQWQD